jgi:hypothetical protein
LVILNFLEKTLLYALDFSFLKKETLAVKWQSTDKKSLIFCAILVVIGIKLSSKF